MPVCLIGLGSNQGDRQTILDAAVARLEQCPTVAITAQSVWHETAPVGGPPAQPRFLNGALTLETAVPPHELLATLRQIEDQLGRRRTTSWGPRTIDLDLLLYSDLVLNAPSLVLPHPRLAFRRFVIEPAAEVAGAMLHPTTGWSIRRLLEHLGTSARYVAVTGPIAAGKTHLAQRLAAAISGRLIVERPDWTRLGAFYGDPAGHGWAMELEFLEQRARLLTGNAEEKGDSPHLCEAPSGPFRQMGTVPFFPSDRHWTVSDFWFDQSAAFARAWLPDEQLPAFLEQFESRRATVTQPRLIVLLDSPTEELLHRVGRRGRQCEMSLTGEQLERIRQAVVEQADRPDLGPVLRIATDDHEAIFAEALAAVQGME